MVYYCLPEEIRRSVAVDQIEIVGDTVSGHRENIRHIFVRYYFPTFLKVCPALSKCCLSTDIIYDDETNEVEFSAELFREDDSEPYRFFSNLLSAMLWCLDREHWPELEI